MNPLVARIQWILDARKISKRELARRSGLKGPHVGLIMSRLTDNPNSTISQETVAALAKGGEVSVAWLLAGEGDPAPGQSTDSPPPPPVSQVRETEVGNDVIDELLAQAWDPEVHGPADARVVGEALRTQAALLKGHVEPGHIVRAMLDTAADARGKGKTIAPEDLPLVALGATKIRLREAEDTIAELMADADEELKRLGVKGRSTPDPILLAQRERMFGIPKSAPTYDPDGDDEPQPDPKPEPQRPKGKAKKKRVGGQG